MGAKMSIFCRHFPNPSIPRPIFGKKWQIFALFGGPKSVFSGLSRVFFAKNVSGARFFLRPPPLVVPWDEFSKLT